MQISVTPNGNQSHIQYLHKRCQNAYLVHILVILAPKMCFVTDRRADTERQIGLLGWGGSGVEAQCLQCILGANWISEQWKT